MTVHSTIASKWNVLGCDRNEGRNSEVERFWPPRRTLNTNRESYSSLEVIAREQVMGFNAFH